MEAVAASVAPETCESKLENNAYRQMELRFRARQDPSANKRKRKRDPPPPDLTGVLQFRTGNDEAGWRSSGLVEEIPLSQLPAENLKACAPFLDAERARVFTLKSVPGFYVISRALSPEMQIEWATRYCGGCIFSFIWLARGLSVGVIDLVFIADSLKLCD